MIRCLQRTWKAKTLTWICSMTDHTFHLNAYADAFVTRDMGRKVREVLLDFDSQSPVDVALTIDVPGIEVLTPSFADEFFAKTVVQMGLDAFRTRFRIIGPPDDIKLLISKVIKIRLAQTFPAEAP